MATTHRPNDALETQLSELTRIVSLTRRAGASARRAVARPPADAAPAAPALSSRDRVQEAARVLIQRRRRQ